MDSVLRVARTYFLLPLALLAVCVGTWAQVSKGSISGAVVDSAGAVVPGAEAKAISVDTSQALTTTTDNSGLFTLPLLPVGNYRLEVSKAGFRKASVAGVGVSPGVDTGVGTITLQVGSTSETVEVTAATPLVETTQAQVTNTFDTTYLNNIPGIQENEGLDNLAVLLPGVSGTRDNSFSNANGTGFTVDGLRGRSNDQQIDGQNNNDNSVAGPGIFMSDSEFVGQYQVVTNNFGAEYGRNAGSVVNVSTKSGTNTWHGSIYGNENNSVLTTLTNQQAQPVASPACPTCWGLGLSKPPRFNDEFTGATIGGPWMKNKIFFFGGFDNQIISSQAVYASGLSTPTPLGISQLAACFPGSTSMAALQAYGPFATGGDPTMIGTPTTSYFDNAPVNNSTDPLTKLPACGYQLAGVQRTLPDGVHLYNWLSRLDIAGAKDNVYVRYLFQRSTFFNYNEGQAPAGYPINIPSLGQDLGASWTHKISDNMLNEVRASVGRQTAQFGGNTIGTIPTDNEAVNALAETAFTSASLLPYGPAPGFPQGRIVNTYQLQDNWSYVRGRHQFKAGTNLTLQKSPNIILFNANGEYVYSDWGNYAANTPVETLVTLGTPKLDFIEHDSFFYFGDDWKINSHLTLNLGLTYSYYGQPANLFHNNDTAQQNSSEPFWNPTLPQSVTVFPNIPAPKNSWGPSVGFAYAVGHGRWLMGDNKTVVRGGYRLSYDPPFYNVYLNIASSAPQVLAQTIAPGEPLPAAPFGSAVRESLAPFLALGVQDPRNFNQTTVSPNFLPDRVHSWTLGIQRELGTQAAVEIRYVGNKGQDLFQSINANPYIAGLAQGISDGIFNPVLLPTGLTPCPAASAVVPSAVGRENCSQGVVRERTNTGYSDYNGLQVELRTNNLFHQLTLKTNYTWSKTTDNTSEIFGTLAGANTVAFSQDPLNYTTAEHGISGLDFPQTWAISFNESIPAFKSQRGIVGHLLGGWSIAGSYILQSGQGYTPVEAFSAYADSPYNTTDQNFLAGFNGGIDVARPFSSNHSAQANAIGIYGADVCGLTGVGVVAGNCTLTPNALYDYTALNSTGTLNATTTNQEHFILNAFEAQTINHTPYGNAARNSLRDDITNMTNFQIAKISNWGERVRLIWHMSMVNALNHPNYGGNGSASFGVDPFLEDAGLIQLGEGFANPKVQGDVPRDIRFGLKVTF